MPGASGVKNESLEDSKTQLLSTSDGPMEMAQLENLAYVFLFLCFISKYIILCMQRVRVIKKQRKNAGKQWSCLFLHSALIVN